MMRARRTTLFGFDVFGVPAGGACVRSTKTMAKKTTVTTV
jgi:hypothetical protein